MLTGNHGCKSYCREREDWGHKVREFSNQTERGTRDPALPTLGLGLELVRRE